MKIKENPDQEYVAEMKKAIKDNHGYCVCKTERIKENICICKEFREKTDMGYCHCHLFYKTI